MGIFNSFKKMLSDVSERYSLFNSLQEVSFNKKGSDFLDYNETSLYVNRAIDIRAEKVGEIEFVMKNLKGEVTDKGKEWIDLLNKPNSVHTGKQFWKLYQKYFDLTGSVFIYLETEQVIFKKAQR